ncbi:MAG: MARVEL domain-containing protein [Christensenellaceae bacterium]|nr:MARVEL domain-containing protein [Christensenellaceae bacterium]
MINKKSKLLSVVCQNCGAKLKIDSDKDTVECQYCKSTFIVEGLKKEADRQEKLEVERLKLESKKLDKEIAKANALAFKKSKFSKVVIVLIIFSLLVAGTALSDRRIGLGIFSFLSTIMLIITYLFGSQVIKENKPNIRLIPWFLGLILFFISFLQLGTEPNISKAIKINWNEDILLAEYLPPAPLDKMLVYLNSLEELSIKIPKATQSNYTKYIKDSKDMGYDVDSESYTNSYKAFNKAGYFIDVGYYAKNKELSIRFRAPIKTSQIKWPTSKFGNVLPIPKSNMGNIKWESSNGFDIYIANTTIEDFNDYVDACKEKGFNVDVYKYNDYFSAKNKDGYDLSVEYEGFNTMSIRIYEP